MTLTQPPSTLGVIVSRRHGAETEAADAPSSMPEDAFCRQLCKLGQDAGLHVVMLDRSSVESAGELTGYTPDETGWRRVRVPSPDIVYDRAMCRNAREHGEHARTLAELRRRKPFILMNGSLPGKWEVYAQLESDERLKPYVPATALFAGARQLAELAARSRGGLFLKPSAGMHGNGALRLLETSAGWRIDGKDRRGRKVEETAGDPDAAAAWIERFVRGGRYIVQRCLRLTGDDGRPFDIRALVQKDGSGRWTFTGAALRLGQAGSVTANLHGGGKAVDAGQGLAARFGSEAASLLMSRMRRLSLRAAERLESRFGRLAEIGFDYGVEDDGRLWLLEANSRPGRQSFAEGGETALAAVARPLEYARLLAAGRGPLLAVHAAGKPLALRDTVHAAADDRIHRRSVQEVHP